MEMNEDRPGKIQINIEKNAEMIFDIFFSIYIWNRHKEANIFLNPYIFKSFSAHIWRNGRTTCFHIHKTKIELGNC
jgi:hypothetical protein